MVLLHADMLTRPTPRTLRRTCPRSSRWSKHSSTKPRPLTDRCTCQRRQPHLQQRLPARRGAKVSQTTARALAILACSSSTCCERDRRVPVPPARLTGRRGRTDRRRGTWTSAGPASPCGGEPVTGLCACRAMTAACAGRGPGPHTSLDSRDRSPAGAVRSATVRCDRSGRDRRRPRVGKAMSWPRRP
jgi:hypothetical protein